MTRTQKYRATRKKTLQRRNQWALRKIRKYKFKTVEAARVEGLICVNIGEGAFRKSYRIVGTSLLIKFPIWEKRNDGAGVEHEDDYIGKCHTRAEVRKIKALKKFPCMRAHLPPVYYYSAKDGVMVTKYFKPLIGWRRDTNMSRVVSKTIKELTKITLDDISGDNVKFDREKSSLIFVDLGY